MTTSSRSGERTCSTSGCGPWGALQPAHANCAATHPSGTYAYPACELPGSAHLVSTSEGLQVSMGYVLPNAGNQYYKPYYGALCTFTGTGTFTCGDYWMQGSWTSGDPLCPQHAGERCNGPIWDPVRVGDLSNASVSQTVDLKGTLRDHCLQATATVGGSLGQSSWVEVQVATLVRF